jgi:hypothetical protein
MEQDYTDMLGEGVVLITMDQRPAAQVDLENKFFDEIVQAKLKQEQLSKLTVDVDGMCFDADEKALQRMTAVIVASETASQTETMWKLADNSKVNLTLVQLKQAQLKTIQALGSVVLNN